MPNETSVRAGSRRPEQTRPGRVLEVAFGGVVLAVVAAVFAMSCGVEDQTGAPLGEQQLERALREKKTTTEPH